MAARWNGKKAACILRTRGRGVGFGVCAGVCAALGVAAADVAAPNVTTVGYINGTMNVVVETVAGVSHEIEMKGVSDADYAIVNFKRESYNANDINRTCYYLSTNYLGEAAFRIRAVADGVAASAWVDCGTHKATLNVTGTLIGTDGVPNRERSTAVDGRVATFIDGTGNKGNDRWVGYLYDSDVAIKAVRFLPRLDHIKLPSRYRDSLFQAASDVSFSDATNIYQVASDYADLSKIAEATFDPPVRARAFRHWKEKGSYEQTAELEFIPAEMPLKPALSIAFTDVTNFYPILSVTFPDRFFCSSFRIERASRKTGPWEPLTETWTDAVAAAPVTNRTDLYVGIPVYYRVAAVTQHPDWEGETVYSEPTVYVRARRLERAWTNETHLLDGYSVMKQTNGTVIAASGLAFERAFDGNAGTFPDATQAANRSGPVGIDFGQKVWVNGFGYICRNDNQCYSRVQYAALYCASGEDPELHDKVACSANPTRYSKDTTFYYQPGTNCPSGGARCWFLYANKEGNGERFYGNVAELMFFGWTQADLDAAPVLRQPSAPVCVRQGASVALSWQTVSHATSYTVQRRERGTDTWTTCATNLQTPAYVDDMADVTVAAAVFEYRVEADGGELGKEASDETAFFYYQPGRGTGLRGAAWWPYARTSTAMEQLAHVWARGEEKVDLSVPAGTELVPGATDGVKFVWTGKLICPMTGNYTFTLDADGGGCVRIDGIDTVNDATAAPSGVFTLTAGEHTIRVEYLCTKTTGTRTCRLVWSSGLMVEEVVPASQLVPDEEMARPVIDGWDLDVLGQNRCNFTETMGGGVYKFTAGQWTWTSLTSGNYQFMSQPWTGGFDFSATVKATGYGHIGLMVRDAEGHAYYPYARNEWNYTHTGVKAIPSDATDVKDLVAPTRISNDARPVHLRLTRTGPSFTLYTRENTADEWVEKTTWTDAGFARTTWVGLATTGWSSGGLFTAEASNIVLKPGRQPLTIILR